VRQLADAVESGDYDTAPILAARAASCEQDVQPLR